MAASSCTWSRDGFGGASSTGSGLRANHACSPFGQAVRKAQARGLEPAHIWQLNGTSARAVYPANTLCKCAEFARASAPFREGLFPDQQVAVLAAGAKAHVATLPQQSASFGRHEHTRALNRESSR
eukprot:scaffold76459_cov76-Phaeocystis_antarctica.AAC.3